MLSLSARCSQPPRTASHPQMLVAWMEVTGFTHFGRLATARYSVTRPNRIRFRCGLQTRSPRLRPKELPPETLRSLHDERAIIMVDTFQSTRQTRFILAHQSTLRSSQHEPLGRSTAICNDFIDKSPVRPHGALALLNLLLNSRLNPACRRPV